MRGTAGLTAALLLTVAVASFEITAAATAMPAALADIGGRSLHPLAFGVPLLTELIALVVGGTLCAAWGGMRAFLVGAALHGGGLLMVGISSHVGVLLGGRAVQGAGAGLVLIAVYSLVADHFDDRQRTRVLGLMAAAWAVPGLLGPLVGGAITEGWSWRGVFLALPAANVAVLAALWRPLATFLRPRVGLDGSIRARLAIAVTLALAVLAITNATRFPGAVGWLVLVVALVIAVLSARPLFAPQVVPGSPGLRPAVLLRGLVGGPWLGTQFLLPLTLVQGRGLTATSAGLVLSCGVIGFSIGGLANGAGLTERLTRRRVIAVGMCCEAVGLATVAAGSTPGAPTVLIYLGWTVTGLGASLAITALNATVLDLSAEGTQSKATSAMASAEAVSAASCVAISTLILHGVGDAPDSVLVSSTLVLTVFALAVVALCPLLRRIPDQATLSSV